MKTQQNQSTALYNDNNDECNSISKTTDLGPKKTQQYIQSKAPALKNTPETQGKIIAPNTTYMCHSDDVINIQILYDPN